MTINSGSTSVKLAAFTVARGAVTQISHEHLTGEKLVPRDVLRAFVAKLPNAPDAMAHRVVHGGHHFPAPVRIEPDVILTIGSLSELAPLHNPIALEWIEAARSVAGADVTQIAAFDTSFFASLPRVAGEYALPPRYGVD